ncbi:MAG: hypothetical protein L0220_16355 [Acidobacteria bacterium]|nr:hypothetical protein [Acidobacteriota bacterium]
MKRKLIRLLILSSLFALLLGSLNSVAQEKRGEQVVEVDIKKGTGEHNISIKGLVGRMVTNKKVVKGAPYSATAITEHTQTLHDGNQIIRKNEAKRYRDSEGRTRNEQTLETVGKWTTGGDAQHLTFIDDPVKGISYNLDPKTRTATAYQKNTIRVVPKIVWEVGQEKGPRKKPLKLVVVDEATPSQPSIEGPKLKRLTGPVKAGVNEPGRRKTESLGKEVIEGVEVEHTRTTLTIPAGEIGNVQPIEVVDETWYSPELQLMIMTKSRDPRLGETTYRLTNITRSEPDPSLFVAPGDYTMKERITVSPKKRRPPSQ